MASLSPDRTSHYRWQELTLMILPFLILIVAMIELLLGGPGTNSREPFSPKSLPAVQDMVPALGLIGVLLAANVIMSIFFRKADQFLLPLTGVLSGIGILMATRQIDADTAFELLRETSQRLNVKVQAIAADVATSGNLPES